jgi:glycosyltransferase involved in cell wall biosynthesis
MSIPIENNSVYFSIIIPVFNRATLIARAINSCLNQDFDNFEVIVVDDGSTDDTVGVVQGFTDPRIRLICQGENRGQCPTRNRGMEAGRGEWFVFLDSDDELLPGGLRKIYQRASGQNEKIGGLYFMCKDIYGHLTPDPPLREEIWGREEYIRWLELTYGRKSEAMPCTHKTTFPGVRWPEDFSEEKLYHLEISKRFLILSCPDVVRLYHHDAENRVIKPSAEWTLALAPTIASNLAKVLDQHGEALQAWAPRRYYAALRGRVTATFLAGRRLQGLFYAARCLQRQPLSIEIWAIIVFGLLGPKPLAWAKSYATSRIRS